jgi:hypothetical protein
MAFLYTPAKVLFLTGEVDLEDDTIKCLLVHSGHVADPDDEFLADVVADTEGTADTLANPTTTDGVFDADDAAFAEVTGDPCNRLLIYQHVTNDADSPVLAMLDLAAEITPDGGDVTIAFAEGGIFSFIG